MKRYVITFRATLVLPFNVRLPIIVGIKNPTYSMSAV